MRLSHFLISVAIILATGCYSSHSQHSFTTLTPERPIREQSLKDMTYQVETLNGLQPVTLSDGDCPANAEVQVYYEGNYVYGDFNHDGSQDAATIIAINTGGNQDRYTLAFLINENGHLVHRASIDLDDRAIINSMEEEDGKVLIDMLVHKLTDTMGGPSNHVRRSYEYTGPDF